MTQNTYPEYTRGAGWYVVLAAQNPHHRPVPARGPFRTQDELEWALSNYLNGRCPGLCGVDWLEELGCVVLGPYTTRAAARSARLTDPVARVLFYRSDALWQSATAAATKPQG